MFNREPQRIGTKQYTDLDNKDFGKDRIFWTLLTHSLRKDLTKNASGSNHRSLWDTIESLCPIMEITKKYQFQIFSCLFAFYSSLSRIYWKNKCYKKQVLSSKIFTLLMCLEINFYVFHNQLKKVWNVNFWGQNTGLKFPQISTFLLSPW